MRLQRSKSAHADASEYLLSNTIRWECLTSREYAVDITAGFFYRPVHSRWVRLRFDLIKYGC